MKYACVTMDTETGFFPEAFDIEMFLKPALLARFKEVVDNYDVKLTGFIVTNILENNPVMIENIMDKLPIRFETHSHSHLHNISDTNEELDKTIYWFKKFFGRPPRGFRAPNGLISNEGIVRLIKNGFVYDASIFPSLRIDKYGYNNLNLPIEPFVYETPSGSIVEMPFSVVKTARLVISMSFVKLFGWCFYDTLIRFFGLPDVLVIDTHPHDFFIKSHLARIKGWKKIAHTRGDGNELKIFEQMLKRLSEMGYSFAYIDDVIDTLDLNNITRIPL